MLQNLQKIKNIQTSLYSYQEVKHILDTKNQIPQSLNTIKKINATLNNPAKKIDFIGIAGTNGKSTTLSFALDLLKEEGYKAIQISYPYISSYTEQYRNATGTINQETFTRYANIILTLCTSLQLPFVTQDIITGIGLLFAQETQTEIILVEHPAIESLASIQAFTPCILGITRVIATPQTGILEYDAIANSMQHITPKTSIVSADQNKVNLKSMQKVCEQKGAQWSMPIRKLAPLVYPYEQLYGRCASLAERIISLYSLHYAKDRYTEKYSLLAKPKAQRGRPTLQSQKKAALHPQQTIEDFWRNYTIKTPFRFDQQSYKSLQILLDTASNVDALNNVLLGVKLLHYQKPLQNLYVYIDLDHNTFDTKELLHTVRYFFKKTYGKLFLHTTHPEQYKTFVQKLIQAKVDVSIVCNLAQTLQATQESTHAAHNLFVICGSVTIVQDYMSLTNRS